MQHGEWEKKNAVRILPLFFSNIERRLNCPSFRLQYFHIVCFKQTLHTIWNNNMRITFYMFLNESHIPPTFVWWIKTQHNYHQFLLRKKNVVQDLNGLGYLLWYTVFIVVHIKCCIVWRNSMVTKNFYLQDLLIVEKKIDLTILLHFSLLFQSLQKTNFLPH